MSHSFNYIHPSLQCQATSLIQDWVISSILFLHILRKEQVKTCLRWLHGELYYMQLGHSLLAVLMQFFH